MRSLSALLLSLVLALASVSMAVARGQAPMGATMALCSQGAAITVTLDTDGNPVSLPKHLCPDCLGAFTALDQTTAPDLVAPDRIARALAVRDTPVLSGKTAEIALNARGPPSLSV